MEDGHVDTKLYIGNPSANASKAHMGISLNTASCDCAMLGHVHGSRQQSGMGTDTHALQRSHALLALLLTCGGLRCFDAGCS